MAWAVLNDPPAPDELIAVHAALLPTGAAGQVVYFGDWSSWTGKTKTRIFDLASGEVVSLSEMDLPTTNLFCAGQAFLADGRLLVAGGRIQGGANLPEGHPFHATHEPGERACWLLNPRAGKWTPAQQLHFQPGSDAQGGGRWYPTLVTLGTGEVFAAAGHPAEDDVFEGRHNNHTPERYAPAGDEWTLMADSAERTAPANVTNDSYPRYHLTREGTLFCNTLGLHESVLQMPRAYHPYGGDWTDPIATPIFDDFYDRGSSATSVLLPLLPSDMYRPRVLAVNGEAAYRIDAGASDTSWDELPPRVGDAAGQRRDHGFAVLLPTAQVALVGGVQHSRTADAQPAFQPEIYDPGIEWPAGEYGDLGLGPDEVGEWLEIADDPAEVARGYHSTALLLPDGRVWTGGSTEVDDSPWPDEERRTEVWQPPYPGGARPTIDLDPGLQSIAYGAQFPISVELPSGDPIERVALVRCGSVTHGFDSDQRYVGLQFGDGAELTVSAPPAPEIAPPGFYMLWLVDSAGRPCEQAAFIRVCDQELDVLLERSTLSRHEVVAMGTPATFVDAFYVVLDGFMPHELGEPLLEPDVTIEWLNGDTIGQIELDPHSPGFESPALPADRSQRVTLPYDLVVLDDSLFVDVPDEPEGLEVRLRASWRHYEVERRLRLTLKANPRMNDGPVEWLSTDLRAFKTGPGDKHEPALTVGEDPLGFLDDLLDAWNALPAEGHPFLSLPQQTDESPLELSPQVDGDPVYNFGIAKVCMVAPEDVQAADVRVFFRLFPTWTLGFEYDAETYSRSGEGGQALPQVGVLGGELRTIPFFAAPRTDGLIAPGDVDVNRHTFEGQGATEVHRYFGSWLDFNHNAAVLSELRGDHPCLVAEIHYPDDPVGAGATPGTSDNLAQRNLAVVQAPNPASPLTRLIDVTFTVTASQFPPRPPGAGSLASRRRTRPDELMLRWGNLPPETQATIYWPDVDVDEIVAAAGTRLGPKVLSTVDAHTISCRVGGTTYVPIPGPRSTDVPGLLTLELPPNLVKGQRYRMTAHQLDGFKRRVVGAVQLDVPIATAEAIVPSEERKLGVLRWIAQSLAPDDRWTLIFQRWLGNVESRVRGMGGDPDTIHPTGPGLEPTRPGPPGLSFTGKVSELLYDCHGDFDGFVLKGCPDVRVFRSCERGLERVLLRACERRNTVTVDAERREPSHPRRIAIHCC